MQAPQPQGLLQRFVADPTCLVALAIECAARGGPSAEEALAVRREIGRLAGADPARLLADLDRALAGDAPAGALRGLEVVGALAVLLPEVQALVGFHRSAPLPHKDLWEHTLTVVERTGADPDLRWIALCHDIGKVATRAVADDGRVAFHRHEAVGARLFVGIGARLAMPPERTARIAFVIEHHARTNQFEPDWSDRALRRLARDCREHLPLMLAFSAADWTTKRVARAERIQRNIALLRERLAALDAPAAAGPPPGLASALLDATGRAPGPWVGEALAWATAELEAGRLDGLDAPAIARRYLADRAR